MGPGGLPKATGKRPAAQSRVGGVGRAHQVRLHPVGATRRETKSQRLGRVATAQRAAPAKLTAAVSARIPVVRSSLVSAGAIGCASGAVSRVLFRPPPL